MARGAASARSVLSSLTNSCIAHSSHSGLAFGRCCRCLVPGHRAAVCRDPLRCSRCLENGHWARGCRNAWRPFSSLACLAMVSRQQRALRSSSYL
uniref:CCHC-type domain-containing protein n=1 Tax=Aegilops tauschii subsp. strangulata TaxID=200361 RepID=A0A452XNI8_AEGTS